MLTAIVAPVQIGHLNIEGLLASNGNFYVGVPQLVNSGLISDRHRNGHEAGHSHLLPRRTTHDDEVRHVDGKRGGDGLRLQARLRNLQ